MNATDFDAAIAELGLSQGTAAKFLGVSLRTVHSWVHREYPIPEAVAKLLRLMIRLNLKPEDVK